MIKFTPLTKPCKTKDELRFAEKQLKKYGAKEGRDYEWREKNGVWVNRVKQRGWSIWVK